MTCRHPTVIALRNVKTRVIHYECAHCGEWVPFDVGKRRPSAHIIHLETKLADALNVIGQLLE